MTRSQQQRLLVLLGCCALSSCSLLPLPQFSSEPAEESTAEVTAQGEGETAAPGTAEATPVADAATAPSAAPEAVTAPQTNYFNEAVNRAQSAVAIGQSAQSTDDWNLAVSRWQQAVAYMQQVPSSDPNYSVAQQKVQEYGQNLASAQSQAAGKVAASTAAAAADAPPGLVTSIPIVGQMGGTPVVPVTLTASQGTQQFEMLFDTGASGTLITPAMAQAVGVVVTGSATVTVADGRRVEIPIGYVDTLQVGELIIRDIWVGIGGDVALLGQDVYGPYGLSIGSSKIDLYE
ncbi:MAG: retropepsin-like aspartic protease [Cyanobacteria bacterium P01_H01_bin.162]